MSRQVSRTQLASNKQMSRQVSHGSAGEYQADEQAGVVRLTWRVSGNEQAAVRGLAGEYQADEQANVTGLSWRETSR